MPPSVPPREPIEPRGVSSPTADKETAIAEVLSLFNDALQRYNVPVRRDGSGGVEGINNAVRAALEFRLQGSVRDTTEVDTAVLRQIDELLESHRADHNITDPGQISVQSVAAILTECAVEARNRLCRKL